LLPLARRKPKCARRRGLIRSENSGTQAMDALWF
jgi:hypothetical protein